MKIEGQVAVVLGASRGIGKAYVEALLAKGAKVCFGDVLVEEGHALSKALKTKFGMDHVEFAHCDVTSDGDIEALFTLAEKRFGIPEIVIANAGIVHQSKWQYSFDVNVGGIIRSTHLAMDRMRKDKGGRGGIIINTASIGSLRPVGWSPVYCATKYAVLGFTLSWALPEHFNQTGVRLNCICPTTVGTRLLECFEDETKIFFAEEYKKFTESQDKLSPSDVAVGMVKLIEDDTINGRAMRVTKAHGYDFAKFEDQPLQ